MFTAMSMIWIFISLQVFRMMPSVNRAASPVKILPRYFGVITIWSVNKDTVCRSWRRSFLRVILILAIALYQLCINLFDRRIISDKIFNSEKGKISVNVLQIAATHPVAPQQACFVLVQLCWKCLRSLIWRTPLGYSFGCLFCKQPLIMKSFDFIERASDLWSDA